MSASEYWTPLEQLLAEATACLEPLVEIPARLVTEGYAPAENEPAIAELLKEHQYGWSESDYDDYCLCGKWLEVDHYELPDHQSSVLDDSGLLFPGVYVDGPVGRDGGQQ